jgi:ketosteroid isomerase-like protein
LAKHFSSQGEETMKRMLTILAMVLACTSFVLGQTGKVEQALMQMERDWTDAGLKADVTTLGRILADDWAAQGTLGATTKAETLADIKSGTQKLESITLGEMKVRVFGDAAVVTGSDDEKSSYKGKDTSGHYVWTDVFVKQQGKLQAVASHGTLVPK